jgi:phosphopantothenoylcysteine decarboxylase/phosphopantothenate--cysteine ligase
MSRILITSGPTREYLDPVRYLSNASSGRMGAALAAAAVAAGHEVAIVSGPVAADVKEKYPVAAKVKYVVTTEEMLAACMEVFPACDGLIAAAAPCDYRARHIAQQKMKKYGGPLHVEFVETPDIVATLAAAKRPGQWIFGFALETNLARANALEKLRRKDCDWIALNGLETLDAATARLEIIGRDGCTLAEISGDKAAAAAKIIAIIERNLLESNS